MDRYNADLLKKTWCCKMLYITLVRPYLKYCVQFTWSIVYSSGDLTSERSLETLLQKGRRQNEADAEERNKDDQGLRDQALWEKTEEPGHI